MSVNNSNNGVLETTGFILEDVIMDGNENNNSLMDEENISVNSTGAPEHGDDLSTLPDINTTPEDVAKNALKVIAAMKKKSTILFANYMNLSMKAPDSAEASRAYDTYLSLKKNLQDLKQLNNLLLFLHRKTLMVILVLS